MENVTEIIKKRRSVRTYDGRTVDENVRKQLISYAESIKNPFNLPVIFKILNSKRDNLSCPVVSGTDMYVGGKIKFEENANIAFGYSFEEFILFAHSIGLGTVWLGGTMNRSAFEKAMELEDNEVMPCAASVGYTANKMSVREGIMRKGIKADKRLPFEELFFNSSFETPLKKEKAGILAEPLEMVRLAPSAVNRQPWRVVITENKVHFYLKRSKGFSHKGRIDMQMIDVGAALCHFALTAKENGLKLCFEQNNPMLKAPFECEYIASYEYFC